jgi:8-oxo-dGTP diphosphatase
VSVLLLRHASAGDRAGWNGDDLLRPLDRKGREQALELRHLDVRRIVSSRFLRCIATVEALAATRELAIELDGRLAEGRGGAAIPLLAELDGGVACTHGDVIVELLGRELAKGAAAVIEIVGSEVRLQDVLPAP